MIYRIKFNIIGVLYGKPQSDLLEMRFVVAGASHGVFLKYTVTKLGSLSGGFVVNL